MKSTFIEKLGGFLCLAIMLYIIASHVGFWVFAELSDGGHVSGDFHEAGVILQLPERVTGFLIAGIYIVLFSISLYKLMLFFRTVGQYENYEVQTLNNLFNSSKYALFGSIAMMLYPTVLSFLFIAMNSMEQNVIIASIEPLVFMLFIISILFFLLVRTIQSAYKNHTISYNV